MARQDKKYNESDDSNKKTFIEKFSAAIVPLNAMISNLKDPYKVKVLEDIKAEFEDIVEKANKSSGPINEAILYESVRSNVKGEEKWPSINDEVKDTEVKKMFGCKESEKVKAYNPNKCADDIVSPLLKLRFFKAHGMFPTNNQLPLYFCKQVIAEVYKQMSVDYISIPPGTGHGKKRHIFKSPEKKKRRMDPENLEVPHNLALMSKNDLLQHSIHLTEELQSIISKFNIHDLAHMSKDDLLQRFIHLSKELQLIISNFNIPLENVSSYVKSYMDPPFPFDGNDNKSTVTAEASHHCLRRDSKQVENHVLDQDHLTPTGSCGGNQDTQFAFGSEGVNSTVRAEASHPQLPKDLEKEVTLLDWPNSRNVEYQTSILTRQDFTDPNGQQRGLVFGSPIETESLESIFAQLDFSNPKEIDFMEFDHARDQTDYSGPPDDDSQEVWARIPGFSPVDQASIPPQEDSVDFPLTATIDSPGIVKWEELSPIHERTILDDEQYNSSNASSLTLYINGILIKAPMGTINVKVLFGLNAILVDYNARQLPMNEEGFIWQDLQQGAVYYAILADSYNQPLVGENGLPFLAPLQQAATM